MSTKSTELRGARVIKKRVSAGSKSDRDAVVLVTEDDKEYLLRQKNSNPFMNKQLDKLVGKKINCSGEFHSYNFIMDKWEEQK